MTEPQQPGAPLEVADPEPAAPDNEVLVEPFATAEPVIRSYAQAVRLQGPAGSGQLTKMVNQIAIAGVVQGLAEALNFARKAGLVRAEEATT